MSPVNLSSVWHVPFVRLYSMLPRSILYQCGIIGPALGWREELLDGEAELNAAVVEA